VATLTIDENPTITDTIVFYIDTPGADGCFSSDPYKVEKITIYFVSRDFNSGNLGNYENTTYDQTALINAENAEKEACENPTEKNISIAKTLRRAVDDTKTTNDIYYKEAIPIAVFGDDYSPVWLSTDPSEDIIEKVTEERCTTCEDNFVNSTYGRFKFTWQPKGAREGDYFICWSWMPIIAGGTLSAHQKFSLMGDTQTTTSIPTHFTNPKKYKTLLDRYLPEMFKTSLADTDVTTDVLDRMNTSLSMGFNVLEDLANQMVDLLDANSLHEFLIPYLSNLFGLKLKTDDPTRWRGQIKRAVPLYKKKGTKQGLSEALEHGGVTLHKVNQLWQLISSYTWQESFFYDGTNNEFILEKVALLPIDPLNYELWFRPHNESEWIPINFNYISLTTVSGVSSFTWVGDQPPIPVNERIPLVEGDEVRILYLYKSIPDPTTQTVEEYIRTLPLMDTRDERNQTYPPKNWNVRVTSEDDPMFSIIIPNRNPFCDCLVYGQVRTEFPYSENIYNMDEYNGSIRNSKNQCDIDKSFVDPCSACVSSSYDLDLEIEQVCDDKIQEVKEIINENFPFHAVLHTLNFTGGFDEYVEPPVENIEALTTYSGEDFVVAGYAQPYFHRIMKDVENKGILRDELANSTSVYSGTGIAYNDEITLFCPSTVLSNVGVNSSGNSFIQIKAPTPSPLSPGDYNVVSSDGNTVAFVVPAGEPITDCCDTLSSEPDPYPSCIVDPLNFECCPPYPQYDDCPRNSIFYCSHLSNCSFTFDLNNPVDPINGTLCNIYQDNIYKIQDDQENFSYLGIKTQKDVDNNTAAYAWTIYLPAYSPTDYPILDIKSDGSILIAHDSSLPLSSVSGIIYSIRNNGVDITLSNENTVSNNGFIKVINRGRIKTLSPICIPVAPVFNKKNCYQKIGTNEYLVTGVVDNTNDQFYIDGYSGGDSAGVNVDMREKLVENKIGYLSFKGLKLQLPGNLETSLGIQNGASYISGDLLENNRFKENFVVFIDDVMYWMGEINGNSPPGNTTITLSGPGQYWKTSPFGGTSVSVEIKRYDKLGATIDGQNFDLPQHTFQTLDRNGRPVITLNELYTNNNVSIITLSQEQENVECENLKEDKSAINDFVGQKEEITFHIDRKDQQEKENE
jgi:hypothetical protein